MEINYFYEELESSSQCSSNDTLESIDLINNNNNNIYRIKHNRNRSRIKYSDKHGNKFSEALAFDVIWETGEETREPIQNLINYNEQKVNEFVLEILDDYIITARKYPHRKRSCIMCKRRVYNGALICKKHSGKYSFLN